ncbi:MAG TPA: 2OG-Fe(II) oxygenase, partial [Myxococcota bacterium]|nr:2OG-Fe(II) oxygenase [Myxococcota bacterium]
MLGVPVLSALSKVFQSEVRPGVFAASTVASIPLPRVEVAGVGVLAFPLQPEQAQRLIERAERSPYGKGPLTLVDPEVRRSWQIGPGQISFGGAGWDPLRAQVAAFVKEALGVDGTVKVEPYKLLLYEPGGFFTPHRDTEKAAGMFATAVVVLPSAHAGGEIVVRHLDRVEVLAVGSDDPGCVGLAAFYADCVHEVRPVTEGYRIALLFNVLRRQGAVAAPDLRGPIAKMRAALRDWRGDEGADMFVHLLEHSYTLAELSFDRLKGQDAGRVGALRAACDAEGVAIALGVLNVSERGWAEVAWSGSRYGRGSEEFSIGEVTDGERELIVLHPLGAQSSWRLSFEDEEIWPDGALAGLDDEVEFSEHTGNEGASFERSYQRTVVVCWRRERSLDVLTRDGADPVGLLDALVTFEEAGGEDPSGVTSGALAARIIAEWRPGAHPSSRLLRLLGALARLGDADLVLDAVDRIGVREPLRADHVEAWAGS